MANLRVPSRSRILDIERLAEVIAEVVRRTGLQRPVLAAHHRLDTVGALRPGELLRIALASRDRRDRQELAQEVLEETQDRQRELLGLFRRGVGGVPLVPEEFGGAEPGARAILPAEDAAPLIEQLRQVAVRLHPLGDRRHDDRFAGRAHRPLLTLREVVAAAARHPGDFRGETLDMVGLALQERARDEHREVGVFDADFLELRIEVFLARLPEGVAIRLEDLAAANRRVIDQSGLLVDLDIPAIEIVLDVGQVLDKPRFGLPSGGLLGRHRFLRLHHTKTGSRHRPKDRQRRAPVTRAATHLANWREMGSVVREAR